MDKELMRALMADGEKLRAMTGEDHGPLFIYDDDAPDDLERDLLPLPKGET